MSGTRRDTDGRSSGSSGGIGFAGTLFLLLLALKLTGYIDWSWWAITAPLWVPAAAGVAIVCVIVVVAAIKTAGNR